MVVNNVLQFISSVLTGRLTFVTCFQYVLLGQGEGSGLETLNYGVTFQDPKKHANELQQLDKLLAQYSSFSSPKLVQGDQQKEELSQKTKEMSLKEQEKEAKGDNHGGKVVPKEVLSGNVKKVSLWFPILQ